MRVMFVYVCVCAVCLRMKERYLGITREIVLSHRPSPSERVSLCTPAPQLNNPITKTGDAGTWAWTFRGGGGVMTEEVVACGGPSGEDLWLFLCRLGQLQHTPTTLHPVQECKPMKIIRSDEALFYSSPETSQHTLGLSLTCADFQKKELWR